MHIRKYAHYITSVSQQSLVKEARALVCRKTKFRCNSLGAFSRLVMSELELNLQD